MNILITGGSGFIAQSLKKNLVEYNIFAPNKTELNVLNENELRTFIFGNSIDIIIHTANIGGQKNKLDEKQTLKSNLRMFFNISNNAKYVKKVIHLGSGAEYSKEKPIIKVEEDDALNLIPNDDYGFYKSTCSKYIENSDNMINLRIFGCFGEFEDYNYKFISNAIIKNLLKMPITINQNVVFDYIYIDDFVKIVKYFIDNKNIYKVYNASSGNTIDLITICNLINKTSSYKSKINVIKEGLNNEYTSSNSRLKSEFKFFELTSNEEAIKKMYKYFESNLEKIDKSKIINDNYLKVCDNIWSKKNENS
jgi:GDP-L-fucose synthase